MCVRNDLTQIVECVIEVVHSTPLASVNAESSNFCAPMFFRTFCRSNLFVHAVDVRGWRAGRAVLAGLDAAVLLRPDAAGKEGLKHRQSKINQTILSYFEKTLNKCI